MLAGGWGSGIGSLATLGRDQQHYLKCDSMGLTLAQVSQKPGRGPRPLGPAPGLSSQGSRSKLLIISLILPVVGAPQTVSVPLPGMERGKLCGKEAELAGGGGWIWTEGEKSHELETRSLQGTGPLPPPPITPAPDPWNPSTQAFWVSHSLRAPPCCSLGLQRPSPHILILPCSWSFAPMSPSVKPSQTTPLLPSSPLLRFPFPKCVTSQHSTCFMYLLCLSSVPIDTLDYKSHTGRDSGRDKHASGSLLYTQS